MDNESFAHLYKQILESTTVRELWAIQQKIVAMDFDPSENLTDIQSHLSDRLGELQTTPAIPMSPDSREAIVARIMAEAEQKRMRKVEHLKRERSLS